MKHDESDRSPSVMKHPPRFLAVHGGSHHHAFSLVELVLAIGIVAFAMVSIMGLIPLGLGSFRDAMNLSVETGVVQRLISDVQLTDLKQSSLHSGVNSGPYYFDDQGVEVTEAEAIITARIEPPVPLAAGQIIAEQSLAAVRTIVVRISNRANPQSTRLYPVIVPIKP